MMIDRYIYAVTRKLPEMSRNEIASELKILINDMIEGMDGTFTEEERIEKVLRELGDPKELANSYGGKERYLIGPNYFDKYLLVMKIVLLSVFIGISIASGLGYMFFADSLVDVKTYIASLFSAILQGAAWVTGIFAILEYKEMFVETDEEEVWEPAKLPTLPEEKSLISKGESIFSIIMNAIFLQIVLFSPEIIGIYYKVAGNKLSIIQLFNIEEIDVLKVIIFAIVIINILIELIKIVKGRWTIKMAVIITMLRVISTSLFIYAISNIKIWNNEIIQKSKNYISISFDQIILRLILIVIFVTIIESVSALYKGLKYDNK